MILVLGGTYDSRKLTETLLALQCRVLYSSVTAYNTGSLPESSLLELNEGALEKEALEALLTKKGIEVCVDVTHPYAKEVSANAIEACANVDIPYIRLERPRLDEKSNPYLGFLSYEQAVCYLKTTEGNILLTTGSRQLEAYGSLEKDRLVLRVLPTSKVLEKCEKLGYKPKNIIAMQGPFSYKMNVEIIKTYNIRFLVTKDSGEVGGVDEKLRAAADNGVQVILIKRPELDYPVVFNQTDGVVDWLQKRHYV